MSYVWIQNPCLLTKNMRGEILQVLLVVKLWRDPFDLLFRFQLQSAYNIVPPTPAQTKVSHHAHFFYQCPVPATKYEDNAPSPHLPLLLDHFCHRHPPQRPLKPGRYKGSNKASRSFLLTPARRLQAPVSALQPAHPPQAIARQSRTSLQDFHDGRSAKRTWTTQADFYLQSRYIRRHGRACDGGRSTE